MTEKTSNQQFWWWTKHWSFGILIGIIVLILFCFLFLFQIQENEYVLILRLGHPQLDRDTSPGLGWRLPYPIEEIWRHDNRIYSFPSTDPKKPTMGELEEVYTADKINIVVTIYLTWRIWVDPSMSPRERNEKILQYMQRVGKESVAEQRINDIVRSAKTYVFGKHLFSELINPDPEKVQIEAISEELLQYIREQTRRLLAIDVLTVGIAHLGLPEETTTKVFDRMRAERQREADRIKAIGTAEAAKIKSEALRKKEEIISQALRQAKALRAEGDLAANQSYRVFEENPELAMFLRQLAALNALSKKNTYIIIDTTTPPFNILSSEVFHQLSKNKLPEPPQIELKGINQGQTPIQQSKQPPTQK